MTFRGVVVVLLGGMFSFVPGSAEAQFSSDFPGIARAGVPLRGGSQGRFELDAAGFKIPGQDGDTLGLRVRFGMGRSWRIASNVEWGFDFSLGQVSYHRPPDGSDGSADVAASPSTLTAHALYGLRVGLKVRPISYLDPEGHGFEAGIGVGYQPQLIPGFGVRNFNDSTETGGPIGGGSDEEQGFLSDVHQSVLAMVAVSYRSERIEADGGLLYENPTLPEDGSLLPAYNGVSPRVGLRFRLTPGFAVGGILWGNGAPPWRDRIAMPNEPGSTRNLALLLDFGSTPGKGTAFIVSSPTGSFSESVGLYVHVR